MLKKNNVATVTFKCLFLLTSFIPNVLPRYFKAILNSWRWISEYYQSYFELNFILTLSDAGVWRLNLESAPPPIWCTFSTLDPKNGSQPYILPRLRYFNIKITKKLCAICCNWHLYVLVILASYFRGREAFIQLQELACLSVWLLSKKEAPKVLCPQCQRVSK